MELAHSPSAPFLFRPLKGLRCLGLGAPAYACKAAVAPLKGRTLKERSPRTNQ